MVTLYKPDRVMSFCRRLLDVSPHRVSISPEFIRAEICAWIVCNQSWGAQVYIDPTRPKGFLSMPYRETLYKTSSLKASRFVDNVEDWLPLDPTDVSIDRVIEIHIVLERKLEPARATTVDLAVMAELSDFPQFW